MNRDDFLGSAEFNVGAYLHSSSAAPLTADLALTRPNGAKDPIPSGSLHITLQLSNHGLGSDTTSQATGLATGVPRFPAELSAPTNMVCEVKIESLQELYNSKSTPLSPFVRLQLGEHVRNSEAIINGGSACKVDQTLRLPFSNESVMT